MRISPRAIAVVAAGLLGISVPGCGGDGGDTSGSRLLVEEAGSPVALVALPGGGLRYGERLTGQVREVDGEGRLRPEPLARLDVSTGGQRGLVGLAVDRSDRTFAAWTDPEQILLVGQVAPGPVRIVWRGPATARIANGGHLEFSPAGLLVVGVGDLGQGDQSGRVLALDPDGTPDQEPEVIASGWNNPFAFAFGPTGDLWVADNAPGDEPERVVRVGPGGSAALSRELTSGDQIAPSALVVPSDDRLVICAYLTAELFLYDVGEDRRRPLAEGCRTGVARLAGGHLAYAGDDEIRVVDDPLG